MGAYSGPEINENGLVLALDAGNTKSYPGSGTTWSDLIGNGNNGTLINGPTYSSDDGGSIVFDGTNDYGTIEANQNYQIGDGYTLCAWVNPSNNPTNFGGICGTFDTIPSSYYGFNFSIQPNSQRFYFLVGGWSGGSFNYIAATSQYTIGNWYYLVGTNSGVNCKFYINGVLDTTYTQAAVASNPGSTTKFKLGRFYQGIDNFYYNGKLASVALYNRELSASEIQQNFNALKNRFIVSSGSTTIVTSGLILNLDAGNSSSYSGSGTTWTDLSSSGNNGTLTNGPTYSSADGGSIVFDGTNDYVETSSGMFNCNSNFTFNSWVNADVSNTIRTIISKRTAGSIQIRFNSSNQVQIVDNNVADVGSFTGFTASASTWYNICVVRSSNTYTLYVNGTSVSSITNANTYTYDADTVGENALGSERWDGKISVISSYNRALTASEVQQNFNALKGRFGI